MCSTNIVPFLPLVNIKGAELFFENSFLEFCIDSKSEGQKINNDTIMEQIKYPSLSKDEVEIRDSVLSMLVPEKSTFLTLVVDEKGRTWIFDSEKCRFFFCKPEYSLKRHIPCSSVVYGLYYQNLNDDCILGIYDVSKLGNHSLRSKGSSERISALHGSFRSNEDNKKIKWHYVGYEKNIAVYLKTGQDTPDFAVQHLARLPEILTESSFLTVSF